MKFLSIKRDRDRDRDRDSVTVTVNDSDVPLNETTQIFNYNYDAFCTWWE